MCIEREKVDFKSCEVNCLKECALALSIYVRYEFGKMYESTTKLEPLYHDMFNGKLIFASNYREGLLNGCKNANSFASLK